jgi:hypothetical protein
MERLAVPSGQESSRFFRKTLWAVAVAGAVIIGLAFILGLPRFIALYELYWSQSNIQKLFYEDLGLSQSWSSFIAVVGSFFYPLAWVPLTVWTYRVLLWRFNASQFSLAFVCWVFVYGHVPLVHALLGTDTCFNQRTGEPTKWFVQDADGRIVLFDSGGFDTATGVAKQPVTTQICTAFNRQKKNDRPRRITADVRQVEFFDATTGRPRVWYARTGNGPFELFDSRGYHPVTSEALLPVTKEVVAEIMKRQADEEAARKRADEELKQALRRADEQRKQANAEALRRAEEERKQAEAEAARRAEEERKQAEAEAARRAEEERKQAETAAARRAEDERKQAIEARKRAEQERKQAEAEARRRATEERKRAEEERRQAEADARRQAEEERQRAEGQAQKRAEEKRILDSYVRTESGALCRNRVRNGEAQCDCGHFMTLGPCRQ